MRIRASAPSHRSARTQHFVFGEAREIAYIRIRTYVYVRARICTHHARRDQHAARSDGAMRMEAMLRPAHEREAPRPAGPGRGHPSSSPRSTHARSRAPCIRAYVRTHRRTSVRARGICIDDDAPARTHARTQQRRITRLYALGARRRPRGRHNERDRGAAGPRAGRACPSLRPSLNT